MRRLIVLLGTLLVLTGLAFGTGPAISAIAVATTGNVAIITWTTDANASSQVFYGIGNTNTASPLNPSLVESHSVTLSGLVAATIYSYQVQSTDAGGTTTSSTNMFAIAGPTISAIAVASVTASSATITWTTNPGATDQVLYGIGNTNSSSSYNPALATSHSVVLIGLLQGTVYTYVVQSTDSGGSTTSSSKAFALCNPGQSNSGFSTVNAGENASYVTGTVTATWEDDSGVITASPTICGNTFSTTQTGTVGLPGNLAMQLPDNNYIIPSPGHWNFTQSNASGLNANSIISGPSIDLTSLFGLQAASSGGSGTVSAGTAKQIGIYTDSTTVGSDANLDDGLTTANTLTYQGINGLAVGLITDTGLGNGIVIKTTNGLCLEDSGGCTPTAGTTEITGNSAIGIVAGAMTVQDTAGSVWNSATGGAKGAGTINAQQVYVNGVFVASGGGTTFTASGCSNSTLVGGATAGSYTSGTSGTCTVTVTTGMTAPHGYSCSVWDITTPADAQKEIAPLSQTTVTFSGTTISGDVIAFFCGAF